MEQKENRVLIHACCGICSAYPISLLLEMGYFPFVYFYNPNIDTISEYKVRLNAQRQVCKHFGVDILEEEYNHNEYLQYINGLEQEPERGFRCNKCFELRLNMAAKKASELGINKFTTSLVISPHKNFELISQIGEKISKQYENLTYIAINFRKNDGFLKTNKITKDIGIYRQNYCGCEFAKSHLA